MSEEKKEKKIADGSSIPLNMTGAVVNCPRTHKTELMNVESCKTCKVFINVTDKFIHCLQPMQQRIYKVGELPKKES